MPKGEVAKNFCVYNTNLLAASPAQQQNLATLVLRLDIYMLKFVRTWRATSNVSIVCRDRGAGVVLLRGKWWLAWHAAALQLSSCACRYTLQQVSHPTVHSISDTSRTFSLRTQSPANTSLCGPDSRQDARLL